MRTTAAAVAAGRFGYVEGFGHGAVVDFADDDCAEQEDDFKAFGVFHFDAGEVGFVDCDFFEVAEEGDGYVWFAVSAFAAIWVCGFAGEGENVVFG